MTFETKLLVITYSLSFETKLPVAICSLFCLWSWNFCIVIMYKFNWSNKNLFIELLLFYSCLYNKCCKGNHTNISNFIQYCYEIVIMHLFPSFQLCLLQLLDFVLFETSWTKKCIPMKVVEIKMNFCTIILGIFWRNS